MQSLRASSFAAAISAGGVIPCGATEITADSTEQSPDSNKTTWMLCAAFVPFVKEANGRC
jgi:hypothetical protein